MEADYACNGPMGHECSGVWCPPDAIFEKTKNYVLVLEGGLRDTGGAAAFSMRSCLSPGSGIIGIGEHIFRSENYLGDPRLTVPYLEALALYQCIHSERRSSDNGLTAASDEVYRSSDRAEVKHVCVRHARE